MLQQHYQGLNKIMRKHLVKYKLLRIYIHISISIPSFISLIFGLKKNPLKIGVKGDFLKLKRSDRKSQSCSMGYKKEQTKTKQSS